MVNYLYILLIIVILYGYTVLRYISILPTYTPLYPDNYKDSKITASFMKNRTNKQISLFYKTDDTVSNAFTEIVPETVEELTNLYSNYTPLILFLKYFINRARPAQVNNYIKNNMLVSYSADTPAYPSGHSFQAYILACKLSKKYPERKKQLFALAEDCGYARIIAGLHYSSDHEFSKRLVKMLCS